MRLVQRPSCSLLQIMCSILYIPVTSCVLLTLVLLALLPAYIHVDLCTYIVTYAVGLKIPLHMCFYFPPPIGVDCITGAPMLYHDLISDPEVRQK